MNAARRKPRKLTGPERRAIAKLKRNIREFCERAGGWGKPSADYIGSVANLIRVHINLTR